MVVVVVVCMKVYQQAHWVPTPDLVQLGALGLTTLLGLMLSTVGASVGPSRTTAAQRRSP